MMTIDSRYQVEGLAVEPIIRVDDFNDDNTPFVFRSNVGDCRSERRTEIAYSILGKFRSRDRCQYRREDVRDAVVKAHVLDGENNRFCVTESIMVGGDEVGCEDSFDTYNLWKIMSCAWSFGREGMAVSRIKLPETKLRREGWILEYDINTLLTWSSVSQVRWELLHGVLGGIYGSNYLLYNVFKSFPGMESGKQYLMF